MNDRQLSIVIGEGASMRRGFLRFVLEGEGFAVAAEASSVDELTEAFADHQPDLVVLDDAFGTGGLELAKRVLPEAKIILVWPAAVQPIGADARVDPGNVLRELGPTVQRVAGITPMTETFEAPEWIGRVRKDPATLREILATGKRPHQERSVTELQRLSRKEPAAEATTPAMALTQTPEITVIPDLTVVPEIGSEPASRAAHSNDATGAPLAASEDPSIGWTRRLGNIALGAAAVAGSFVLSVALGSNGTPVSTVGEAPIQSPSTGPGAPGSILPSPSPRPGTPTQHHHHAVTSRGGTASTTGGGATTTGGTPSGGGTPGGGGGTPGTGSGGGTSGGGGGGGGKPGGGGGGTTGGGTTTPGHSGDHNPHGGPPGKIGHGTGPGGNPQGNGNGNGNGNANGHGASGGHRLVHHHKA